MELKLQQAIVDTRAGRTDIAQSLLTQLICENPDDANAWFLLGHIVDTPERQALYLQKTIELEPEHAIAKQRVMQLENRPIPAPVIPQQIPPVSANGEEITTGQVPGDTLKLIFPGGQKDGIKVVVHGLKLPQHGEEGVYFVENTSQRMVNPFYGWTQGQFLVTRDAQEQIPRILTADGSPVLRISPAVAPTAVLLPGNRLAGNRSFPALRDRDHRPEPVSCFC